MRQFPRSARGVAEQWTISPGDKLLTALSMETSPQGWRGSGVWRRILNASQRHSCGAWGPRLGMTPPGSAPWGCRNKAAQWADALPPDLEARSSRGRRGRVSPSAAEGRICSGPSPWRVDSLPSPVLRPPFLCAAYGQVSPSCCCC